MLCTDIYKSGRRIARISLEKREKSEVIKVFTSSIYEDISSVIIMH